MGVERLPAALGAYLFAFGAPRLNQIIHSELWAEFYPLLAVWLLIRFLQMKMSEPGLKAVLLLTLASAAVALQLISGFYFGWFLCFSLLVAFVFAVTQRLSRQALLERAHRFWPALIVAAVVFLALTSSGMAHYRAAADELNVHDLSAGGLIMPTLGSWLYAGDDSLLYSWVRHIHQVSRVGWYWERANGIGVITWILVLTGAITCRRHPVFSIMFWVTAIVLMVTFTLPGGWTLWRYLAAPMPGSAAVRVPSRWGVFLLLPFAVALGCCLDRIYRYRRGLVDLLGTIVVLEQVVAGLPYHDFQVFEREAENYAAHLKAGCDCFLVSRPATSSGDILLQQMPAMWAQIVSGIPTLNGYSGSVPPAYPFHYPLNSGRDYPILRTQIDRWQQRYLPPGTRTCWIRSNPAALAGANVPLSIEVISAGASTDSQNFVRWSYLGILGRLPRPNELAFAETTLNEGRRGRVDWIFQLMDAPESRLRAFVEETYLAVLGRDADFGGWWDWTTALDNGSVTKESFVERALNSDEYRRRCAATNSCRPPSDAAAFTREIVLQESDPNRKHRVDAQLLPLFLLGRPADPDIVLYWTHQFDMGKEKAKWLETILGSKEYQTLVGKQS
jgi:hypothetical protein